MTLKQRVEKNGKMREEENKMNNDNDEHFCVICHGVTEEADSIRFDSDIFDFDEKGRVSFIVYLHVGCLDVNHVEKATYKIEEMKA